MGVIGEEDAKMAMGLLRETGETSKTAGKSMHDLGEEEKKTGEHAGHAHLNHRALHQILHQIGNESAPGMGHALGALMLGPLGVAVALGSAYEVFKKHIEEVDAEAEKQDGFTKTLKVMKYLVSQIQTGGIYTIKKELRFLMKQTNR